MVRFSSPTARQAQSSGYLQVVARPTAVTPVTSHDLAAGHRFPEFLPDGRHFLFLASIRLSARQLAFTWIAGRKRAIKGVAGYFQYLLRSWRRIWKRGTCGSAAKVL